MTTSSPIAGTAPSHQLAEVFQSVEYCPFHVLIPARAGESIIDATADTQIIR